MFQQKAILQILFIFFVIFATKMFKLVVHDIICSILCFFFWFFTHNMRRVVWLRTFWGVKRTPWFGRLYKQTSGLDLPQLRLQWIQMRPPFSCILLSPYIIIVSYSIIPSIIILSASSTQGRIPGSLSRAHQSGPQRDIRNCQMIMNKQYLQPMIWGSVR